MLDLFQSWDIDLLLKINQSGNNFLDPWMRILSDKWIWLPLYALIFFFIIRKEKSRSWIAILLVLITVGCADYTTSGILKPLIERWRPCKTQDLASQLRLISDCTGKYGFASSHAANTAALAFFIFGLFERKRIVLLLFLWTFFVGYSRVYLGAHYPSDVVTGWIIGVIFGSVAFLIYTMVLVRKNQHQKSIE